MQDKTMSGDGIALKSASHPGSLPEDINAEALEEIEIELPDPPCLRTVCGEHAVLSDNLIISDQLQRIEMLLIRMVAEMRSAR